MTHPLSLARKRKRLFSLSYILPPFFVMMMGGALIFLAAILPLQGIGANDALLSHGYAITIEHTLSPTPTSDQNDPTVNCENMA